VQGLPGRPLLLRLAGRTGQHRHRLAHGVAQPFGLSVAVRLQLADDLLDQRLGVDGRFRGAFATAQAGSSAGGSGVSVALAPLDEGVRGRQDSLGFWAFWDRNLDFLHPEPTCSCPPSATHSQG
jgi:hypothetical protein